MKIRDIFPQLQLLLIHKPLKEIAPFSPNLLDLNFYCQIFVDPSTSQFSPTEVDEQELSKGLAVPSRSNCVDDKAIETVVQNAVSSKLSKVLVSSFHVEFELCTDDST